MKKIISLFATVAMISTLFVSVVKADFTPTVTTSAPVKMTADEFQDLMGEAIPTGYDVYTFTVSFSNLGDLTCSISSKKHTGRKIQGFGYQMTFDDITNLNTSYVMTADNIFSPDDGLTDGFDGNKFSSIFNAGSATAAYPKTATTISNAEGLEDAIQYIVAIAPGAKVTATLDTNMNIVNYAANVYGEEETVNHATMSPASIDIGSASAPTPTTYTVTFMNEDGTDDIQSNDYDENDGVTAPTAPAKAGYTFTGWSESVGGAVVDPIATATADKTYYAVYTKDAGVTEPTEDVKAFDTVTAGLTALDGTAVTLDKNYGIAKFSTALDLLANDYYLIVEDADGNIKDENDPAPFKIDFGAEKIETTGTVNFFALVKSDSHVIKSIMLKAVAKE